jgi:hypothetical protein
MLMRTVSPNFCGRPCDVEPSLASVSAATKTGNLKENTCSTAPGASSFSWLCEQNGFSGLMNDQNFP